MDPFLFSILIQARLALMSDAKRKWKNIGPPNSNQPIMIIELFACVFIWLMILQRTIGCNKLFTKKTPSSYLVD
jgi:hypothetical protein